MNASCPTGCIYLVQGCAGACIPQVVQKGVIEEDCILRDNAEMATETGRRHVADVDSVNADGAASDIVEPKEQLKNG
jgi:hypothetical protein